MSPHTISIVNEDDGGDVGAHDDDGADCEPNVLVFPPTTVKERDTMCASREKGIARRNDDGKKC